MRVYVLMFYCVFKRRLARATSSGRLSDRSRYAGVDKLLRTLCSFSGRRDTIFFFGLYRQTVIRTGRHRYNVWRFRKTDSIPMTSGEIRSSQERFSHSKRITFFKNIRHIVQITTRINHFFFFYNERVTRNIPYVNPYPL